MHVTITFSVKQGQTRTTSGPIWVPLNEDYDMLKIVSFDSFELVRRRTSLKHVKPVKIAGTMDAHLETYLIIFLYLSSHQSTEMILSTLFTTNTRYLNFNSTWRAYQIVSNFPVPRVKTVQNDLPLGVLKRKPERSVEWHDECYRTTLFSKFLSGLQYVACSGKLSRVSV